MSPAQPCSCRVFRPGCMGKVTGIENNSMATLSAGLRFPTRRALTEIGMKQVREEEGNPFKRSWLGYKAGKREP